MPDYLKAAVAVDGVYKESFERAKTSAKSALDLYKMAWEDEKDPSSKAQIQDRIASLEKEIDGMKAITVGNEKPPQIDDNSSNENLPANDANPVDSPQKKSKKKKKQKQQVNESNESEEIVELLSKSENVFLILGERVLKETSQDDHMMTKFWLLYGPSGTGKFTFAYAFSNTVHLTFFKISHDLLCTFLNDDRCEAMFQELFKQACAKNGAIIFFEKIEELCKSYKNARKARQMLLDFSKDHSRKGGKVIIIGSTNLPMELDNHFVSHLTAKFFMDFPDRETIKDLFKKKSQDVWAYFSEDDLEKLANLTQGFSGRDITEVVEIGKEEIRQFKEIATRFYKITAATKNAPKDLIGKIAPFKNSGNSVPSNCFTKRDPRFNKNSLVDPPLEFEDIKKVLKTFQKSAKPEQRDQSVEFKKKYGSDA